MSKEKMSLEELIKLNPDEMTNEQVVQYKQIQAKAAALRDADMKLYNGEVVYKETQAREHKASRDMKVFTLENMKATIEMEELFESYQSAIAKGNERMEGLRGLDPQKEEKTSLISSLSEA